MKRVQVAILLHKSSIRVLKSRNKSAVWKSIRTALF